MENCSHRWNRSSISVYSRPGSGSIPQAGIEPHDSAPLKSLCVPLFCDRAKGDRRIDEDRNRRPGFNQPEGGVANVVHNTAEGLRRRGHDVTCLFKEDVLSSSRVIPRFESVYFAFRLAMILSRRKNDFDVAHIHAPCGFIYGLSRRFRPKAGLPPYVMMLHGIEERRIHAMGREAKKGRAWYFRWKNRMWEKIYHLPLYRWSIQTADHAVVINWEIWTMLQLKYDREIGRVWYVPNGVEDHYFIQREFAEADALRLLFVGTWLDHKGVYYLRDGFEELVKRI